MCEDDPDYTSGDEAMVADTFPRGHASCQRALKIQAGEKEEGEFSDMLSACYMDTETECSRVIWAKGYLHPKPSERLTSPEWMETVDKVLDKAGCRICNGSMYTERVDGKLVWHKFDKTTCTCRVDRYMRWVKTYGHMYCGDGFLFHPENPEGEL